MEKYGEFMNGNLKQTLYITTKFKSCANVNEP